MLQDEQKDAAIRRLKKAAGQVVGIQKMIEDDRYCVDVLNQISATRSALGKVGKLLLETHIETCVSHAFESGDEEDRAAKMDELLRIFEKNCQC